jgi:putative membrane protein
MLPENFLVGACGSLLFGVVGIILFLLGYFAFDKLTPKLEVEKELAKGNMAVGVVVGARLVSIAIVISSVLH